MQAKGWSIVLVASLGLNLFLLGVTGAHLLRRHRQPAPPGPHAAAGPSPVGPRSRGAARHGEENGMLLRRLVKAAGGPRDPRVRAAWESERATLEQARHTLRDARRDVEAALLAEPYRAEALEAALGRLRESSTEMQARSHRTIAQLAARLTPEERARLGRPGPSD